MKAPMLPPDYVNIDSSILYDQAIPNSMLVTYMRLRGLAWKHHGEYTEAISMEKVLEILGLKKRAMWQHLSGLKKLAPLRWESPQPGHFVFFFDRSEAESGPDPPPSVQKNALALNDDVKDFKDSSDSESEELKHHHDSQVFNGGVPWGDSASAKKCTALVQKNALELEEHGITHKQALFLAGKHDPDRIRHALDVFRSMKATGKAQGPAWLRQFLEEDWPDPPEYKPAAQVRDYAWPQMEVEEPLNPEPDPAAVRQWEVIAQDVSGSMSRANFDTWIRDLVPVGLTEAGEIRLATMNEYARDKAEEILEVYPVVVEYPARLAEEVVNG